MCESKIYTRQERIEEVKQRLDKNTTYYHCFGCGILFEDKKRTLELISLYGLGKVHNTSIPRELLNYHITTGLCGECLNGGNSYE